MTSVARIGAFVKEHSLVVTLFVLLGAGLFFRDGKQMPIDVYMAAGVLGLYVIARYCHEKQRELPSVQGWVWSGLLLYVLIRTLFSDDVGYSMYAFVRYIDAFLIYYLFYCYSNANTTRIFTGALMVFSVFVVLSTVVLPLSPRLVETLSQMSLLYGMYGHNHAADLIVFGFSAATILWTQTKMRKHLALTLLFLTGTALYFARVVFLLEAILVNGLFLYDLIWKKHINKTLLVLGPILTIVTTVLIFIPYARLRTVSKIFPSYSKQSIWQDVRWEYWRQSAAAIRERPWFGSGPGTFYLQSVKYQKEPGSHSWFAHGFPLEVATETGLVGLVLMILVVVAIIGRGEVKQTRYNVALLTALCLVFTQSVFDYSLDYIVVWILAWAAVGVVFSRETRSSHTGTFYPVIITSLVFIGMFFVMNMFLLYGKSIIKPSLLYIPLCASDLPCAKSLLSRADFRDTKIPPMVEESIRFFHRRNSEMTALLAAGYQAAGDSEKSYAAYRETLTLNPQNNIMSGIYISLLLDNDRHDLLLGVVEEMIITISARPTRDIEYIRSHWEDIRPCFNASTLLWSSGSEVNTYQAKSIYFAGLCLIKNLQFDEARELFRMASDARTSWSNIYLDYAGLLFWRYHDMTSARQAIDFCKANINSRGHCAQYDGKLLPKMSVTDKDAIFIQ